MSNKVGRWSWEAGRSLTLGQRRVSVLAAYLGYLGMVTVWYLSSRMGSARLFFLVIPFGLFMLAGLAVLFTSWVWHAANEPDAALDERQQRVRDRAYLYSYRGIAGVAVLATVYGGLAWDNGLWLPNTWNQVQAVVWGILLLAMTLPSAVIAWTEPELPLEV